MNSTNPDQPAKSYGLIKIFFYTKVYSKVPNFSVSGQLRPDQTAHAQSDWAFPVRICFPPPPTPAEEQFSHGGEHLLHNLNLVMQKGTEHCEV